MAEFLRRLLPRYLPNVACAMFVVGVASATLGILPEWYSFVWSALSGAPAGPLPSGEHAIHAGWFQAVGWPLMVVSVAWRQMQD